MEFASFWRAMERTTVRESGGASVANWNLGVAAGVGGGVESAPHRREDAVNKANRTKDATEAGDWGIYQQRQSHDSKVQIVTDDGELIFQGSG